jgi:hypothetical protein
MRANLRSPFSPFTYSGTIKCNRHHGHILPIYVEGIKSHFTSLCHFTPSQLDPRILFNVEFAAIIPNVVDGCSSLVEQALDTGIVLLELRQAILFSESLPLEIRFMNCATPLRFSSGIRQGVSIFIRPIVV